MSQNFEPKRYVFEYRVFQKFVNGQMFSLSEYSIILAKSLVSLFEGLIRYIPGGIGYKLRYLYYKFTLNAIGTNVLIDTGVFLSGAKNISIGDYTWIDNGCIINAMLGEVSIGNRVHIAPYSIIGSREPVIIEDFVAIGAGSKIYSNSQLIVPGKRMSGPMIPEIEKAFYSKKVVLRRDSFLGANVVVLPGVEINVGSVIGANSVVTKSIPEWVIASGVPAKKLMSRQRKQGCDV